MTRIQMSFDYLSHSPEKKDYKNYRSYSYLINQKPNSKNYDTYYQLACSLWELKRMKEAEQLFLNIIYSTEKHLTTTWYHSSDVPGDTTTNLYGYGSYSSNYKNSAAIYLTKIYISQKKFDNAYKYLEDAVNKYKVTYTCGTGYHWQKNEYDFLYARCYEGLKKYNKVLDLLIPECLDRSDEIIIRVIKRVCAPAVIRDNLLKAEKSIQCSFDALPSFAYRTRYSSDEKTEKTDTISYCSGTATINLFGKNINMPIPNLENGEEMTRQHFIDLFKESVFYTELAEAAGISLADIRTGRMIVP